MGIDFSPPRYNEGTILLGLEVNTPLIQELNEREQLDSKEVMY